MANDVKLLPEAFDAAIRALLPEGWSSAWGEESHDWRRARGYANTAIQAYLSTLSAIPSTVSGETGWQDIATAPKDGTWLDLWAGDRRIPDVRWLDDVGADEYGNTSGWVDARAQFVLGEDEWPEFWMRVERPANPAETQAVEVGK